MRHYITTIVYAIGVVLNAIYVFFAMEYFHKVDWRAYDQLLRVEMVIVGIAVAYAVVVLLVNLIMLFVNLGKKKQWVHNLANCLIFFFAPVAYVFEFVFFVVFTAGMSV